MRQVGKVARSRMRKSRGAKPKAGAGRGRSLRSLSGAASSVRKRYGGRSKSMLAGASKSAAKRSVGKGRKLGSIVKRTMGAAMKAYSRKKRG